jgi:hypothetical protein
MLREILFPSMNSHWYWRFAGRLHKAKRCVLSGRMELKDGK